MTNDEYFNDKPMKEAIAKWRADCNNGYGGDIAEWLNEPFFDNSKGKFVRGRFFTYEEVEEKIRKMESMKVTGFLLEWKDEKGGWFASEFEPMKGSGTNRYIIGDEVSDDWFDHEVNVGFFKELSGAWLGTADDWDFRLGVDFDCRKANETKGEVWEGKTKGGCNVDGDPWRIRKVTIGGELSEKAKEYIRRNPDVCFDYAK